MRRIGLAVGLGLLIAALAFLIVCRELTLRRLQGELATLHRQKAEIDGLREENRELAAKRVAPEEVERLMREHAEIDSLQVQIAALKSAPSSAPTAAKTGGETVPASEWKLAGRDTPKTAFESVLWAATHQEIDSLAGLLNFDAKTRDKVDAFFAQLPEETRKQYGTPAKIAATMLAANLPPNLSAMTDLSETVRSDSAKLLVQVQRSDGTNKSTYFNFQKGEGGWQLLVPSSVLDGYEQELTNNSESVTEALANGQKP